jgi:tape measure domain-containing protein
MSTVISKYAYKAVWDASELSKGLMNTRALFQQQKKIVEDSRTPFDRLAIGQENLNKLIEKYPELAKERVRLEKELEKQYLMQESALRKLDSAERARLQSLMTTEEKETMIAARREQRALRQQRGMDKLSKSYAYRDVTSDADRMSSGPNWAGSASVAGAAGGGMGLGKILGTVAIAGASYKAVNMLTSSLSNLATRGVEANRVMERAETTFLHFGGSAEVSARMVARLKEMSSSLGVSFKSLSGGASQLMMKGFTSDETLKRMAQLAQVAGGDTEKMNRLATAMAQVKDKGRFYAEEMQQLQEAGFSPIIELAQVLGVAVTDVRKEMEAGNVTWVELGKAMDLATGAGGRYNGFLEKFKGTSTGAANEAAAAWESAYAAVGKALEPIESRWSKLSTAFAKDIENLANSVAPSAPVAAEDPKAAARKKNEQDRAQRLADARKREQDALKEQAAREAEQKTMAGAGTMDAQFEAIKKLAPEEEVARFEKLYGLLTDFNKERAKIAVIENQKSGLGLGNLTDMLDEETKKEWEKLEAMQKQVEQKDMLNKLEFKYSQLAKGLVSDEQKQIDALYELEMAKRFGGLSQENYDREARKIVAMDSSNGRMASSVRAGSQEAYQFMAGNQDRGQREKMQEKQENKLLQERMIKAIEKVEAAVKDSGLEAAG